MYRLTVDGVEHYVVAIRNVFSNHLTTHKKFDLKGSTVDREASDKEKEKDLPTYKDNDFVKEGMKIYIGEEAKAKLIETLTADVEVSKFPRPSTSLFGESLAFPFTESTESETMRERSFARSCSF